ncbi:MAG TPA: hypothetical protein VFF75_01675 [Methylophilaceae bacterium]|nr:hypothetical protein [Methylophilaceae bacterium]
MLDTNELTPDAILHGEQLFAAAIDTIVQHAEREILIFDKDLGRGGYSSLTRAEALRNFLAKGRNNKLVILLHDTDFLTHRCPRLMQLIRLFTHSVAVHKTGEEARTAQDSFMLADGAHYLHRFHGDHARFRYGLSDEAAVRPLKERFAQILETSTHTVTATTLGL